jgi:hypothetical protein
MNAKTKIKTSKVIRGRCYACDAAAVGLRDRRPEGGDLEKACARHAEAVAQAICQFCDGVVRPGSIDLDGHWAHARCHNLACDDKQGVNS